MGIPHWLLRLLPMWDYICPRCRKKVPEKSRKCPHCQEPYSTPLRVPSKLRKDKQALENYVHKHVFPKVSGAHRSYLTRFFTTFFSDGFESGDFSSWTGTGGSPSVVEDSHHGAYSMERDAVDDRTYQYLPSAYSVLYGRFYWKLDELPSNGAEIAIFRFYKGGYGNVYVSYGNNYGYYWKLTVEESLASDTYMQEITVDTW